MEAISWIGLDWISIELIDSSIEFGGIQSTAADEFRIFNRLSISFAVEMLPHFSLTEWNRCRRCPFSSC